MQTVIITIHLLVVIALVGVILIQRSEGGGLGIGGGSGFMTARGTKNALTRLTAILAACFFVTSIILTVLQLVPGQSGSDILKQIPAQGQKVEGGNLLDQLGGPKTDANSANGNTAKVPAEQGAASPAAAVPQNSAPAESGKAADKANSAGSDSASPADNAGKADKSAGGQAAPAGSGGK